MLRALAFAALFAAFGAVHAQDTARGKQIASQVCAACHGADGNSVVPANPKLAGQIASYLHKQLADFKPQPGKKPARENAIMNAMVTNLSDADMASLAAYFSSQSLKPALASDKQLVSLGEKIWRGGVPESSVPACEGCHGPAGAGIPKEFPRIAGQFAQYLAGELKLFREGARANDPNGMMRGVASRLSEHEMRAVAEYAAGLR